jgi:hypothetical protein
VSRSGGGHAILRGPGLSGTSAVAIKNCWSGLFLASDGVWSRHRFYFPVQAPPGQSDTLELGPAIVDHVPVDLLVTFENAAGTMLGKVIWADIVPSRTVRKTEVAPTAPMPFVLGSPKPAPAAAAAVPEAIVQEALQQAVQEAVVQQAAQEAVQEAVVQQAVQEAVSDAVEDQEAQDQEATDRSGRGQTLDAAASITPAATAPADDAATTNPAVTPRVAKKEHAIFIPPPSLPTSARGWLIAGAVLFAIVASFTLYESLAKHDPTRDDPVRPAVLISNGSYQAIRGWDSYVSGVCALSYGPFAVTVSDGTLTFESNGTWSGTIDQTTGVIAVDNKGLHIQGTTCDAVVSGPRCGTGFFRFTD